MQGVTTSRPGHLLPSEITLLEEFHATSALTGANQSTWQYVHTNGVYTKTAGVPDGAVNLSTGSTAGDEIVLQLNGEPYEFDFARDMIFECELRSSSTSGGNIFFGLGQAITTSSSAELQDDIIGGTSGCLGFRLGNDATINYLSRPAGGTSGTGVTGSTYAASTWLKLTVEYRAASRRVLFYVDGAKRRELQEGATGFPNNGQMMTFMAGLETTGGAFNIDVRYMYYRQDRTPS